MTQDTRPESSAGHTEERLHQLTNNDARMSDAPKVGVNAFGQSLIQQIRAAVLVGARRRGVSVAEICAALSTEGRPVGVKTFRSWLEPERHAFMRADVLFEMLAREDVVPEDVRRDLFAWIAQQCGFEAVDAYIADPSPDALALQVLGLGGAFGVVSDAAERALEDGALSDKELAHLRGQVDVLRSAVAALSVTLDSERKARGL